MDAMVTARMPAGKKEAGARVLKELGLTASQAINMLWDELISTGKMPGSAESRADETRSARLAKSIAAVDSFPFVELAPDLASMTIKEARAARLEEKYGPFEGSSHASKEDFL